MTKYNEHITIDGNDYKNLILNAAKCLEDNKDEINELNVSSPILVIPSEILTSLIPLQISNHGIFSSFEYV